MFRSTPDFLRQTEDVYEIREIVAADRGRALGPRGRRDGPNHQRHDFRTRRRMPQGLALPGVTVNATSPNLQGVRTVVTTENGDYVLSLLPSGTYTVSFELSGFQTGQQDRRARADAECSRSTRTMGPAAHHGNRQRRRPHGGRADADGAGRDELQAGPHRERCRPTGDINAVLLMAPNVHASGPERQLFDCAAPMSFESLFLINGVNVNENLRGQPHDAVHRRRGSGNDRRHRRRVGRIRPVQRRRGEHDHQVGRQHVQRRVPRLAQQRQLARLRDRQRRASVPHRQRRGGRPDRLRDVRRHRRAVEDRPGRAAVPVHVRRSGGKGSPVVLHGGPLRGSDSRRQHDRTGQHSVHVETPTGSATRSSSRSR